MTRVTVQLGALSHFTPEHFREHFEDATRGTLAEGADVDAELDERHHAPRGRADVVLDGRGGRGLMCLGSIALLVESWDDDGVRVGRLDDGAIVPLAFVPDAAPGRRTCSCTSAFRSRCSIPRRRARRSRFGPTTGGAP